MILFGDTDIILKLAALDLLGEALESLALSADDVRVLPSARYYVRSPNIKRRFGDAAVDRAIVFLKGVTVLADEPPKNTYETLLHAGLDSGEALLFASASLIPEAAVATGDKRALAALTGDSDCKPVTQRLAGHVLCLEEILLRLLSTHDYSQVLQKVVAGYECDTAVRAAFGSGLEATSVNVVRSLTSRVEELDRITGQNLLWRL